jgi:hypothetical protein
MRVYWILAHAFLHFVYAYTSPDADLLYTVVLMKRASILLRFFLYWFDFVLRVLLEYTPVHRLKHLIIN